MSKKIDKLECARLVVEAIKLSDSLAVKYDAAVSVGIAASKISHIHKKSLQRFHRRYNLYDTAIDTCERGSDKIYVGNCDGNTPLDGLHSLTMHKGDKIYFDISEPDKL